MSSTGDREARPPTEEPAKILLVDDRPANLTALKALLEHPGYEVILAASGEQALQAVLEHEFAVILLDIAMPGLDGFETARLIKTRARSSRIPIVFVTASVNDIADVYYAYTIGAVDFLQKPVDPHALRAKVSVFVELYRQARQIRQQAELLRESQERERELLEERAARTERALGASEARFRTLQESGLIGVFHWTLDGALTEVNEAFRSMLDLPLERLRNGGLTCAELTPVEFVDVDARALRELRESGVCGVYEKQFFRADGSRSSALVGGALVPNSPDLVVSFALDVTERKRIEEERARLVGELQDAVRARDEFLSIAAHELKTPLTPLRLQAQAMTRALERTEPAGLRPERISHGLTAIDRSVRRLEHLVENLLDISRVTHGRLTLETEDVDLAALARDVVDRMRESSEQAGCSVTIDAPVPVVGQWDRMRLEQLVGNLLSNAIKYGAHKPVRVTVERSEFGGRLSVVDQGIGIAEEAQQRIFQRFERLVSLRHFGGFGLGLWISRQIIDAHGGDIEVTSRPGAGSCFTVELPYSVPQPTPPAMAEAPHLDA